MSEAERSKPFEMAHLSLDRFKKYELVEGEKLDVSKLSAVE